MPTHPQQPSAQHIPDNIPSRDVNTTAAEGSSWPDTSASSLTTAASGVQMRMASERQSMDDLLHLDDSVFREDETLTDRMRRLAPKFDMTNASLTAVCGNPPIPIHSQDDDASSHETTMFNILVTLINVPDQDYTRSTSALIAAQATNTLYQCISAQSSLRQTETYSYAGLWTIWSELFNFIKQIPVEHHAMQRLVDWIIELRKIEVQTLQIWGKEIESWKDLPLLGPEWVEWVEEYYANPEDCKSGRFKTFRDLLESSGGYALWNYWR
ncbi:hypothetical protein E4T44_02332 [Aureobasidium sp. EXF-8845]|nr:hypothetical protein E4T44_02332 [Aureobasidium sp. EXF-8845]KAI4856480.1 hypothetical protein E4T45_02056 [Aureobasidium sp. EXF-8846]